LPKPRRERTPGRPRRVPRRHGPGVRDPLLAGRRPNLPAHRHGPDELRRRQPCTGAEPHRQVPAVRIAAGNVDRRRPHLLAPPPKARPVSLGSAGRATSIDRPRWMRGASVPRAPKADGVRGTGRGPGQRMRSDRLTAPTCGARAGRRAALRSGICPCPPSRHGSPQATRWRKGVAAEHSSVQQSASGTRSFSSPDEPGNGTTCIAASAVWMVVVH